MITLNGSQYGLVLLDTNALSEFLLAPNEWCPLLYKKYFLNGMIPSYSAFSVVEVTSRPEVLEKFVEILSVLPSIMLDGYDSIFRKEVDNYETGRRPSPTLIAPSAVHAPELNPQQRTLKLFELVGLDSKSKQWKNDVQTILDGMLRLKGNYPPSNGTTYSITDIQNFVEIVSKQQVQERDPCFLQRIGGTVEQIDISQFPSITIMTLIVFYKFYLDRRRPTQSDVFDIIISSILPYVDVVITEAWMRNTIATIQRRHGYLPNLKALSMADEKKEIPSYTGK